MPAFIYKDRIFDAFMSTGQALPLPLNGEAMGTILVASMYMPSRLK